MSELFVSPAGHRFAVLGFGRAGRAATDWLLQRGARVAVYERNLPQDAADYHARGCEFYAGELPPCIAAEALVRSPVIRPDHPTIRASVAAGARLTGETELFLANCPAPVIGVTGSDGKTTTASLIAALLRGAGYSVVLGGNNGVPLLREVHELTPRHVAVLELSSFQLMTVARSPEVAVVTNITPNHLDWHTDIEEYVAAKRRIFEYGARRLVLNAEDPATRRLMEADVGEIALFSAAEIDAPPTILPPVAERIGICRGEVLSFLPDKVEKLTPLDGFSLAGRHNIQNLLAALAAVRGLVSPKSAAATIPTLRGVRHRLEAVTTANGVRFINSSIDTSPTRTAAALSALAGRPLVIAGGRGKGIPLTPLGEQLATRAAAVFLYGETAGEIAAAIGGRVPTAVFCRFSDAFFAAANSAKSGDTVLLSPGCTAFGEFRDFEERGETFCRLVDEWKRGRRE